MRKVCRLAREVLDIAAREVKPGVTTDHIDKVVHQACLERKVSGEEKNFILLICVKLTTIVVLSLALELRPLPQIGLHIRQRGYLPWYP